jgi:hypothetical protein
MPNCVVESATHAQAEWYPAPKVLEKVLGGSNRFGERSALSVSDQYCQSLMTKSVGHAMLIALVVVEICGLILTALTALNALGFCRRVSAI